MPQNQIVELVLLLLSLMIGTLVGVRNSKRDFQPPVRAHVERFLAGLPVGFMFALFILP